MILSLIGIVCLIIFSIPYVYYICKTHSLKNIESKVVCKSELPHVDIVINTYRNRNLIIPKLENVYETDYPNFSVFLINDGFDENVIMEFTKINFANCNLINKLKRYGKSKCINDFLSKTNSEFIILSDIDTFTNKDTFRLLISELLNDDVGSVCANVKPKTKCMETHYRSVYEKMCIYDSRLNSTFNFNGQLVALKKSIVRQIPLYGADDANIAFESIISGKQSKYVQDAICYELIPESLLELFKQKIRRANGLINSILYYNKYKNNNKIFWKFTYFMRKYMTIISPIFLFAGFVLIAIDFPIILIALILIQFIPIIRTLFFNNLCLLLGLLNRKNIQKWDKVKLISVNN